jgi:rubrerythrin
MPEDLTLRESVQLAVTTEQLGGEYYDRMAKKFSDDKDVSQVFSQLAEDERSHEAQFKSLLDRVPKQEDTSERYELYQFLRATAISEFFTKDYFRKAEGFDSVSEALGSALAFEKATLLYYQALRDVLGEDRQLDAIINAEKNHVVSIARILPTDAKFRGLGDKF